MEERVKGGNIKLRPDEWRSGENIWLMDVLGPVEVQKEMISKLKEQVFKEKKVKSLQPAPDGKGMAAVEW
uniref:RTX toxin-activating lysine-acyltransferase n=1 Tax=Magnetococcus massalia (strain MO-1) TaxID=451514 RepID=A0A1S7LFN4_MAGMO|nr:protein of unknown function [Candidatus Magnetococcus massalia]